jgi:hypothetical protein
MDNNQKAMEDTKLWILVHDAKNAVHVLLQLEQRLAISKGTGRNGRQSNYQRGYKDVPFAKVLEEMEDNQITKEDTKTCNLQRYWK